METVETNKGQDPNDLLKAAQNATSFKPKDLVNENHSQNGSAEGKEKPKEPFKQDAKPQRSNKVSRAWLDHADNFRSDPDEEIEDDPSGDPDQDPEEKKPQVSKREAMASASTMVQGLDLMQTTIFYLVEVLRYKNSFRNHDWKEVKNILYEERAKLTPEKQALFDLVIKRQKKFGKRKDEIRMGRDELQQRKESFLAYYQETGKKLDPSWGLWINIITSLGLKGIDVAFDDGY